MEREGARKHFVDLDLSYKSISELDIRKLANMLETELIEYIASGDFHASQMDMSVAPLRKKGYAIQGW